jgi:uncharacterized phiE125 gp8 family phage protein
MVTDVQFEPNEEIVIVSLARAKKHLRLESSFDEEDDLIESYISAAIEVSENFIGGHILEKNMTIKMNVFDNPLVFEAFPLQSVTSVQYYPLGSEVLTTVAPVNYILTSIGPKVFALRFKETAPKTAERFDAVTVIVKVGSANLKTPKPVQQAILLQVGDMYERREDRTEVIATAAMSLLRPYKKY